MKLSKNDLTVVQNLYLLQVDLLKFLESDLNDPEERKQARKQMKEFADLLKKADWRYMGGEDVLDSMQQMQGVIAEKINRKPATSSVRRIASTKPKAAPKKKAAKPVRKVAAKKTAKKVPKKKK